ncbi:hypothetical protein BC832DRAFT_116967 [Gaertneriomyces semiglobifer]|nr:hypothetical protein BC832DRAFT_116967 [Gaertneriomyces semiglobifer]
MERFSRSGSSARQLESFSSSRKPVAAFSGSFDERVPRKVAGEDLRSRPPSLSELRNYREKRDDTRSRQSSSRSIKGQDIHRSESRSNWSERRSRQGSREREYQGDRRRVHRSSSTEEVSSGSSHVPDTAEPVRCILYKGNGVYVGQVKLTAPKSATETLARREIWGELLHLPGLHLRHMLDLDHAKRAYASWDSAQDFLVAPIESEDFQDQARLSSLAKYLKEKEKVGLISHGSLLAIVAPSENSNEMFRQDINQVAHLQLSVVKVSCALKAFGSTYLNLPKLPYEHHSLLESYHRALYKKLHGVTKKFQSFLKGSRVWPFAPSGRYTSEFKCLLGYYGAHTVDHALDADIVFIHQSYISRIPTMSELTKLKRRPVHFLKWGSTLATMQESPEVSIVFPGGTL